MAARLFTLFISTALILFAFSAAAQEPPYGTGEAVTQEPIEAHVQTQNQAANTAEEHAAKQGMHQQRNPNTGEPPVQGEEVREGPYGDKQYHKRQGAPEISGGAASTQKQGKPN